MESDIDHVLPSAYLGIAFGSIAPGLEDAFLMAYPDRSAVLTLIETFHLPF
jgi:hypothetical protein